MGNIKGNTRGHPKEASREPRVTFNKPSNKGKTNGSTREKGNPSNKATGSLRPRKESDSGRSDVLESRLTDAHNQTGYFWDKMAIATAFEHLNRFLATFLSRLSRTNQRSEKSRSVVKKPKCCKDNSRGHIDTWIEVMKLHFEEEDLPERQKCSALTSNLKRQPLIA